MTGLSVEIRTAAPDELPEAVAAVVAAFVTDPVARFACPSPYEYLRTMPLVVRVVGRASCEHGAAHVTPGFGGAALWLPPGVHPDGEALVRLWREAVPADRLDDLFGTLEKAGQSHPDEPHWYLPMIGVEPNAQGRGLGAALLRFALDRCDREGVLAYLESSNPRNIPLYERHGFEPMGRIEIGAAPLVTPMLRRPRRPRSA